MQVCWEHISFSKPQLVPLDDDSDETADEDEVLVSTMFANTSGSAIDHTFVVERETRANDWWAVECGVSSGRAVEAKLEAGPASLAAGMSKTRHSTHAKERDRERTQKWTLTSSMTMEPGTQTRARLVIRPTAVTEAFDLKMTITNQHPGRAVIVRQVDRRSGASNRKLYMLFSHLVAAIRGVQLDLLEQRSRPG